MIDGNWTCPSCATPNAASSRFCSECGGKRTMTDLSMSGERTIAGKTPRPASSPDLTIGADRTITGGEATAFSAQPQASAGQRVGRDARYELVSKLGEGGMGAVWKARDTQLGREVALKRMLGSASRVMRERFQRETQAMVGLRHPNVVTLYDAGEDAHGLYIVMEYVAGKTLAAHLAGGAMASAQANEVITGVCRGAAHAHKKGVVHRDIKPGNIMIDEDGTPRLLDFGLVRMAEASELSMAGVGMGTLDYAAPEQKRDASKADARSDVYALGLVIYEMLTGMRPPVSLKRVPAAWRTLIEKATDPVPEERHATADALLADVVALTSQPASSAALPAVGDGEDDLRCPKCAQVNLLESRLCRSCGTSLRANCMACGESIRVGLKNCDRCFAPQASMREVMHAIEEAGRMLSSGQCRAAQSALAAAAEQLARARAPAGSKPHASLAEAQQRCESAMREAAQHREQALAYEAQDLFDEAKQWWERAAKCDREHASALAGLRARQAAAATARAQVEQQLEGLLVEIDALKAAGDLAAVALAFESAGSLLAGPGKSWHAGWHGRFDQKVVDVRSQSAAAAEALAAGRSSLEKLDYEAALAQLAEAVALDQSHAETVAEARTVVATRAPERDRAREKLASLLGFAEQAIADRDAAAAAEILDEAPPLRQIVGQAHWRDQVASRWKLLKNDLDAVVDAADAQAKRKQFLARAAMISSACAILVVVIGLWVSSARAHARRLAELGRARADLVASLQAEKKALYATSMAAPWDEALVLAADAAKALAQEDAAQAEQKLAQVAGAATVRQRTVDLSRTLIALAGEVAEAERRFALDTAAIGDRATKTIWREAQEQLAGAAGALAKMDPEAARQFLGKYRRDAGLRAEDVAKAAAEKKLAIEQEQRAAAAAGERARRALQLAGFRDAAGSRTDSKTGLPTRILHMASGAELVLIPAGEFTMGTPTSEAERGGDEVPHRRQIRQPFYLGANEVTQAQWRKVMGSNPSAFRGDDLPVEQVSWEDCQQFLTKVGGGLRLPSEVEWEYACRAGTTTPFAFGATITPAQVNYDGNYPYGGASKGRYRERTVPAGSLPPNAWGLHEMHGNVSEWCQDGYGAYPGSGTEKSSRAAGARTLRGGSWDDNAGYCRAGVRLWNDPVRRSGSVGLRIARNLPE